MMKNEETTTWLSEMKYIKVAVTGGAGFIGSHLVDRLLMENCDVTLIDNLVSGSLVNVGHNLENRNLHFEKCDIRDSDSIRKILKGVEVIFHEAALSSVQASIENPMLTNSVNVEGTLNLLKIATELNADRFVYASSAAVYGDTQPSRKTEDMALKPMSPYGVSKLAAENYVRAFNKVYNLETVCLRYFNVYGPRQLCSPYSGVIASFLDRLSRNQNPLIYGDGEQTRDFIHVQDVVEANILTVKSEKAIGEAINIATGNPTSINQLAETMLRTVSGHRIKKSYSSPRKGDIKHCFADIGKATRILGFYPKYSMQNELPKLLKSYQLRACIEKSEEGQT